MGHYRVFRVLLAESYGFASGLTLTLATLVSRFHMYTSYSEGLVGGCVQAQDVG